MIELKNSEKPLNEQMLKDFELSFNVTLPKEFKELYCIPPTNYTSKVPGKRSCNLLQG
jgi:hypothetical protein